MPEIISMLNNFRPAADRSLPLTSKMSDTDPSLRCAPGVQVFFQISANLSQMQQIHNNLTNALTSGFEVDGEVGCMPLAF